MVAAAAGIDAESRASPGQAHFTSDPVTLDQLYVGTHSEEMKALARTILALAVATVLTLPSLRAPASAAPAWEVNYARSLDGDPLFLKCTATAWYGGSSEWDSHYDACFIPAGDHVLARDEYADGDAAVAQWVFYKYVGGSQRFSQTITRRGVCIYTGGSKPGHRSGECNKDLPERGYLILRAGKRVIAGSTRLSDMRFGGRSCWMIGGSSAVPDDKCLFAP